MGVRELYEKKQKEEKAKASSSSYRGVKNLWMSQNANGVREDINNRLNTWVNNYQSFIDSYNNRVETTNNNEYRDDAGRWASGAVSAKMQFDKEANEIRNLLDEYKDFFVHDAWAGQVLTVLAQGEKGQSEIVNLATKDMEYWSNWESEDAYKKALAEYEDYTAKANLDIGAEQEAIDELKTQIETAKKGQNQVQALKTQIAQNENKLRTMGRYDLNAQKLEKQIEQDKATLSQLESQYGYLNVDALEKRLAQKEQNLVLASRVQEGERLASVVNNADFEQFSEKGMNVENPTFDSIKNDYYNVFGFNNADDLNDRITNKATFVRDNQEEAVKSSAQGFVGGAGDTMPYYDNLLNQMTDEEVKIYSYYVGKGDYETADRYLETLADTLAARQAGTSFEALEGRTGLEMVFGIAAGLDQFMSGAENLVNAIKGEEDYIPSSVMQHLSGMVREDLDDTGFDIFGNSLGQIGYDAITTTANMLPSILVSQIPVVGGALGSATLGASAAGNAYAEMINAGYDKGQARTYAALIGGSEAGLQYLLGGISSLGGVANKGVMNTILSKVDNAFARTAIQIGSNMASEFTEESLQTILEPWFKSLVTNTDFEAPNIDEVLYSGLLGALTAGVLEGSTTIAGTMQTASTGRQIKGREGAVERLKNLGSTLSPESVAYKLAGKVNNKTGAYTIGRLFYEAGAQVNAQNKADIEKALTRKGVAPSDAVAIANAFEDIVNGAELTKAQKAIFESNPVVSQVISSLIVNPNHTVNQRRMGLAEVAASLEKDIKTSPKETKPTADTTQQATEGAEGFIAPKSDNLSSGESGVELSRFKASEDGVTRVNDSTEGTEIAYVEDIKDGNIILRTTDGQTVNADDVSFKNKETAYLYETLADMGISTPAEANRIIRGYDPNADITLEEYARGINEAYQYGAHGYAVTDISSKGMAALLSEEQRAEAHSSGRNTVWEKTMKQQEAINKQKAEAEAKAKEEGKESPKKKGSVYFGDKVATKSDMKTKLQKTSLEGLTFLAETLGVDVHLFESYKNEKGKIVFKDANGNEVIAPNGWINADGSIWLDINAGNDGKGTMLFTMSHELTHFIQRFSPVKYQVLCDFLVEKYSNNGKDFTTEVALKMKRAKENGREIGEREAYDEVIADACSTMLLDSNAFRELASRDKTLAGKIKEFLQKFVAKIRATYEKLSPDEREARFLRSLKEGLDEISAIWTEGLVDAGETYKTIGQTKDVQTEFSLRDVVENTKDLVAFHNITPELLESAIGRGSLIMPSIAVTNKGMTQFGDISLVFDKNTIDPERDVANKLYGADAWTPTQTPLKKNAKFDADKTIRTINSLKASLRTKNALQLFDISPKQFQENIKKADGSIYDAYAYNMGMQAAYALEKKFLDSIPTKNGNVDIEQLKKRLDEKLDTDAGWGKYKKWLNNISDTIITSYDVATNEEILKNMKAQPDTAKKFKLSENGSLIVPATEYTSLEEVRQNRERLSEDSEAKTQEVAKEFLSFARKIGRDSNVGTKDVVAAINNSFDSRYSSADIVRSFSRNGVKITPETARQLQELYRKAIELPTRYFEAKPQREILFNEARAAVIPDNTDADFKAKLKSLNLEVIEYVANNEASRIKALNSVESVKFSERDRLPSERRGKGYDGLSMSNNAREAYADNKMPMSKWTKSTILDAIFEVNSEIDCSKLNLDTLKTHFLQREGWHHTSKFYNATSFYGINEQYVESLSQADVDKIAREQKPMQSKPKAKRDQSVDSQVDEAYRKVLTLLESGILKSESGAINRLVSGKNFEEGYQKAVEHIRARDKARIDNWRKLPADHYRQGHVKLYDTDIEAYIEEMYAKDKLSRNSNAFKKLAAHFAQQGETRLFERGQSYLDAKETQKAFSLRDSVEETKDLVAVHNLNEEKLLKSLQLGGLPMPSIAIIRAREGHSNFGNISLVFGKETIDPQFFRSNKVYSEDAWTPTYPQIDYKANEKVAEKVSDLYYDISKKFGYDEARPLYSYTYDLDDVLNRYGGEAGLIKEIKEDTKVMQLYLLNNTGEKIDNITKETKTELSKEDVELYDYLISKLGKEVVEEIFAPEDVHPATHRKAYLEKYGSEIEDAYRQFLIETYEYSNEEVQEIMANRKGMFLAQKVLAAARYLRNGAVNVKTEVDFTATREAIKKAIAKTEYNQWVEDLFKGIEEKSGIRNNIDLFTPSGNRRSFEALHYEHNLENVIKAMKEKGSKGIGFSGGSIFGASTKEFSSISDIKSDAETRLQSLSDEEFSEIKKGFTDRFFDLASSLPKNKDSFTAIDSAANMLVEAVVKYKTKSGIASYIRRESQGWADYSDYVVDDLIELVKDIQQMPTRYFEAKPERAVGFDEVKAVIIPDNSSAELKTALKEKNFNVLEYPSGNKEERTAVLNSIENVRFSERDSDGNELSREQQEYFKDSKVRDENGNLLVMYHGTNNNFQEFKSTYIGSNTGSRGFYGRGFYFTTSKTDASNYGDKVLSFYINAKNPLNLDRDSWMYDLGLAQKGDYITVDKIALETLPKGFLNIHYTTTENPNKWLSIDRISPSQLGEDRSGKTFVQRRLNNPPNILPKDIKNIAEIAQAKGYDCIVGEGTNIGDTGEEIVIFNSNQAKEITNLSPTSDPDIRYSERDQEQIEQETEARNLLGEEISELELDVKELNKMVKATKTKISESTEVINKVGRMLMEENAVRGRISDLTPLLKEFYSSIEKGDMVSWEAVNDAAAPVVDWIQAHYGVEDAYTKGILTDLRKRRIYLDETQKAEVASAYGSYNDFRRKAMGRVIIANTDSVSLDTVWQELAELYPEYFDAETNTNDMPAKLMEIVDTLQGAGVRNEYFMAEEMAEQSLAMQVYDSYWKAATLGAVNETAKKLSAEHRSKMQELRSKHKANEDKLKKRYQAMLKNARQRAVESRSRTELRHRIKKEVKALNNLLLKGTKDKHVMDGLQSVVAEALEAVNMDTVGASERIYGYVDESGKTHKGYNQLIEEALAEGKEDLAKELTATRDRIAKQGDGIKSKLEAVKNAYDRIQNSSDSEISGMYYEEISDKIASVVEEVGNTPLRFMTTSQLESVLDLYKMVRKVIRDSNKAFKASKAATITDLAESVSEQIYKAGGEKQYRSRIGKFFNKMGWDFLKPEYFFRALGSETELELYHNMRDGEDVFYKDATEANRFITEMYEKYNFKSWNEKETKTFTAKNGKSFDLTLEQMMSIYAYTRREQARDHLVQGGIVFEDAVVTKKKAGIPIKYDVNTKTTYNLSVQTLADIVETLTPEQKAFVEEMQEYLSTTMGAKGNEVSMDLFGVRLFKEKYYFPLKSSSYYMNFKPQEAGEVRIKNPSFSKETVKHANNPVVLSNFTDVWAKHVNDMAMYHAFTLPLEDFTRVYNYKTKTAEDTDTTSVKATIASAYGEGAKNYIEKLLRDLNGGVRTESAGALDKLIGLSKKGAVMASASVVIQQVSAIARAYALVDSKYFVKSLPSSANLFNHKKDFEELKTYAPIAGIKEMGYFDVGMGRSTVSWIKAKDGVMYRIDDKLSKAPAFADELVWVSIWQAVKRETVHNNPNLNPKSEEFLKKAGERFTEVVSLTQVYDSVFSRSGMMRSQNPLMKMATAFMAEPTVQLNMLIDMGFQGKRLGGKEGFRFGARTVNAVVSSMVLNAALKSIVMAARDDDEDETYAEKYVEAFSGDLLDSLNPITLIPIAKDILSIFRGYDVARMDMNLFVDLKKAIDNFDNDNISQAEKWADLAGAISAFFGVPLKNVKRDIMSVINVISTVASDNKTTAKGLRDAILEGITGDEKSVTDKLYEAISSGDEAYLKEVQKQLEGKNYSTYVRKALRENDPRIRKAAEAGVNGDVEERVRIAREIIAEGNFSQDDVVAAINSEISAILNASAKEDAPATNVEAPGTATSVYKATDIVTAFENGDTSLALEIIEELVDTHIANGKTEKEAKSSVRSSMTSKLKPMYIAADSETRSEIRFFMKDSGLYGRASDILDTCKGWLKSE